MANPVGERVCDEYAFRMDREIIERSRAGVELAAQAMQQAIVVDAELSWLQPRAEQ